MSRPGVRVILGAQVTAATLARVQREVHRLAGRVALVIATDSEGDLTLGQVRELATALRRGLVVVVVDEAGRVLPAATLAYVVGAAERRLAREGEL